MVTATADNQESLQYVEATSLTSEQCEELIDLQLAPLAYNDPVAFAALCFRTDRGERMLPEPFHVEWLTAMRDYRRLVLIAPRNHAKSMYLLVHLLWMLGRNPRLRIVLVSETEDLARQWSAYLMEIIEKTPQFRMAFPNFPGPKMKGGRIAKWTPDAWQLSCAGRDATFLARGRGGAIVGQRADIVAADDLITARSATSDKDRIAAELYFRMALLPLLDPKTGITYVTGTRYHEEDLYATLANPDERLDESERYKVLTYQAINEETGKVLWPERFSAETLEGIRLRDGEASFAANYLCRISSVFGEVFRREWFSTVEQKDLRDTDGKLKFDEVYLFADTAMSQKTHADYTALVAGALGSDGNVYVLSVKRGKWGLDKGEVEIIQFYDEVKSVWEGALKCHVNGFSFEESQSAQSLKKQIIAQRPDISVTLTPHENLDKFTRANRVSQFYRGERVRLLRADWNKAFIDEHVAFTPDKRHRHDDMVDACVYLTTFLFNMGKRAKPKAVASAPTVFWSGW